MTNVKMAISITLLIVFLFVFAGCNGGNNGIDIVEFNPNFLFMRLIHGGTFRMGDTLDYTPAGSDQKPIHTVVLTYDYYIGIWEVTVEEYCEFLNSVEVPVTGIYNHHKIIDTVADSCEYEYIDGEFRIKHFGKSSFPVNEITWWGAMEYCNWLSREMGVSEAYDTTDGRLLNADGVHTTDITEVEGYRLPTEAEWEYAARGAQNDYATVYDYMFSGSDNIEMVSWYANNSTNPDYPIQDGKGTHAVQEKTPNEINLYDMSGNVYEWCNDYYDENYYSVSPSEDPIGPLDHPDRRRVIRGGSWFHSRNYSRVSNRNYLYQNFDSYSVGFRVTQTSSFDH